MLPSNYYRSRSQELTLFRSSHVFGNRQQATEQQLKVFLSFSLCAMRACVCAYEHVCVIHLSQHLQFLLKDLFMDSICVHRRALCVLVRVCVCVPLRIL